MKNSAIFHSSFFILHFLLLGGIVGLFNCQHSLPQLVCGDDALAVAFGGARETISLAMVQKADSYFHGGIDMDGGDECGVLGAGCGVQGGGADPWAWIDSRIRAPHVHEHLEGGESVEMLPWLWAAVKSDPHNAEAWSVAWYTASHVMKDKALAAKVLDEAKERNPDSIEIAFTEGRALYDGGKGDLAAAKRAFRRTVELANAKCNGDTAALSPREEESFRFAGNYLKAISSASSGAALESVGGTK